MLSELCSYAGLEIEEIGFVSGPTSRFGAVVMLAFGKLHRVIGWLAVLPLRPLFDPIAVCVFGATAVILASVTVSRKTVVAAGAMVAGDMPQRVIVGGGPAKTIRSI